MKEKVLRKKKIGLLVLILLLAVLGFGIFLFVTGIMHRSEGPFRMICGIVLSILSFFLLPGLTVIGPNEAAVLTLFGEYYGTLKDTGFYYINPFCTQNNPAKDTKLGQSGDVKQKGSLKPEEGTGGGGSNRISMKAMTLSNSRQKVNDALGNPVEISIAVIWRVKDTAKAVFEVDNYKEFLSLQCDAAVREIVKIYPYDIAENIDTTGDGKADDGSLRGSMNIVAGRIKDQLQEKVYEAGLEILDTRITYLAYAMEIAAAMLQRQQAKAVIDARKMIVDGAVGMVEMALSQLEENGTIKLDEERKAAMVSNLLVVLCGNKDAQPIVNSGSIY